MLKLYPENIDFSDNKRIIDILSEIAWHSKTQKEITDSVTELREAAIKARKAEPFDELIKRANELLKTDAEFRESGFSLRYRYTFDDYTTTETPYKDVFFQPSQFLRNQRQEVLALEAREVGFSSFKKTFKMFCEKMRRLNVGDECSTVSNPTNFPQQPLELDAGEWLCSYDGVQREVRERVEIACRHPIMPVERLVNIDTGEEKLKVAYYKGKYWREIIVGKKELFDASKIIQLAAVGVSVTSKTAKSLSEFMCDIEAINYDILPEYESVSRLGYIGNGEQFSPYVDGLIFDGDANYSTIYSAITEHGSYEKWLETAIRCRNDSITAQIMLAASFASVLIGKIGALCFFVHLWGVESGTGKTVALMLAASVWGNPEIGKYPQTFNATQVGHEKTAAFLNNVPLCIDELQLSKDSHGRSKFDVYQLSQGVGRTRGNKGGGVDKTPTWSLCVITTGESPIVSDSSGSGAVNRVIDIECRASDAVIRDGIGTSRIVKQNYGFAGKKFVESLTEPVLTEVQQKYELYFKELSSGATTEKQAMAAAMLLTADEFADRFIFKTGNHLTVSQISEFLKSKSSVSAGERGYSYMCDWVAMNTNRFKSEENNSGECYGVIDGEWAYINNSVFRKAAKDAGFDDRALLSWLKTNGLIQTRGRNMTRGKRINNVNTECVVMKLHDSDYSEIDEYEELLP